MSCEEIIAFRKPQLVSISPDGGTVAYTVRAGRLADNRSIDTVCLVPADGGMPAEGPSCDKVTDLKWGGDGALYFLGSNGGQAQVSRVAADGAGTVVVKADATIGAFAVSPDGKTFYYTTIRMTPEAEVRRRIEEGYVYDWDIDSARTIVNRTYGRKEWEDVWATRNDGSPPRRLYTIASNGVPTMNTITSLSVSPSGKWVGVFAFVMGSPEKGGTPYRSQFIAVDARTGDSRVAFADTIETERSPCWMGGDEVGFLRGYPKASVWRWDIAAGAAGQLEWAKAPEKEMWNALSWNPQDRELQAFGFRGLCRLSLDAKTTGELEPLTTSYGQAPSLDARAKRLATVSESSTEPPEVAVYDMKARALKRITRLNPQLDDLELGRVEKLKVEIPGGVAVSGYLLHPVSDEPGRRHPLIVATYGFMGKFITDAEWHSSFPAQTLAGRGYAVLMLNVSGMAQSLTGDFRKAQQIEGWNKLAIFEKAVDMMIERGIADPEKVALYGWSHGGFVVEFLISHSGRFKVACMGEGGDYNPGMFWAYGSQLQTHIFDNIFGGPPWGKSLKAYEDFSAFYSVERIQTPLLMEYVGGLPHGLEMYTPLRYLHIPAELVLYEGEEHNFVKPRARLAAMNRKMDWINYWLLGKRDPAPEKSDQYARWDRMKADWESSRNPGGG